MREAAAKDPRILLCAVTGIAACNLGEQVTTINSLLHYFDLDDLKERWTTGRLESRLSLLHASGCRRIVLDEVSMMDGRQLHLILAGLELVNEALERSSHGMDEPFEPLNLTLTGDFLQLPPVEVGKTAHAKTRDGKEKGCFAFEIPAWSKFDSTVLSNIRRQADPRFILALREARRGNGMAAAQILSSQCVPYSDEEFNGTTLLAKNAGVDKFNMSRMLKLQGPDITYDAKAWGKDRPEWRNIPMTLSLRKGALVMILANCTKKSLGIDEPGYQYVNGDLGIFVEKDMGGGAQVKLHRTGSVVTVYDVTRQNLQPVKNDRMNWLRVHEPHHIKDNYEITGEITHMPLRAAWASTVHKAQGLSLDAVQVDLRDGFFQTPGMAYVALTRCRTMEGLRIVGGTELLKMRCQVDNRVRRWL